MIGYLLLEDEESVEQPQIGDIPEDAMYDSEEMGPEEEVQEEVPSEEGEEINQEDMQDDGMAQEPGPMQAFPDKPNSPINSINTRKMEALFNNAQKLYELAIILSDSLSIIDYSTIDVEVVAKLSQLNDLMARYKIKLRDFIAKVFIKETFEKNLYIYFSLGNELLAMVKYLRCLLNLEVTDLEEEKKLQEQMKA